MRKLLLLAIAVFALAGCKKEQDDNPILYIDVYGIHADAIYIGMPKSEAVMWALMSGKSRALKSGYATSFYGDGEWIFFGENTLSSVRYYLTSGDESEVLSKKHVLEQYYNTTIDDNYFILNGVMYYFKYKKYALSTSTAVYSVSVEISKPEC